MEIRVLKYFLMTAREENITKAARLLHITQPTLSRQLMQLEEELGVKLFERGKTHIRLTADGMLLKRRAMEIVGLSELTVQEFAGNREELSGEIGMGCGETENMSFISRQIVEFRRKNPLVRFNIYSATADEIKERMERGLTDIGLLMEPVDINRYEFLRMPEKEIWGVTVREDSSLAKKDFAVPEDLLRTPLIMPRREDVRNELAGWFGGRYEELDIAAIYNLTLNGVNMVKNGVGVLLGFNIESGYSGLKFVPLKPELSTRAVLVWKKNQMLSPAVKAFTESMRDFLNNAYKA